MININDYKSYYKANYDFFKMLAKKESIVYDRLLDFFKVLGYVELLSDTDKKIDSELEVIFETGFGYFHEQVEQIKTYYNDYFHKNYSLFNSFSPLINYSLYLDDLTEALDEKGYLNKVVKDSISKVAEEIENILIKHLPYTDDDIEKFNLDIQEATSNVKKLLTTQEIFALIVEEMQL